MEYILALHAMVNMLTNKKKQVFSSKGILQAKNIILGG
jgi:hypothetical protein